MSQFNSKQTEDIIIDTGCTIHIHVDILKCVQNAQTSVRMVATCLDSLVQREVLATQMSVSLSISLETFTLSSTCTCVVDEVT